MPVKSGIKPRSGYFANKTSENHGASVMWSREIYGVLYSFTFVRMPDGERRWFVSKYNGYIGGPKFGCAWSRVGECIHRASGEVVVKRFEPKMYDHGMNPDGTDSYKRFE